MNGTPPEPLAPTAIDLLQYPPANPASRPSTTRVGRGLSVTLQGFLWAGAVSAAFTAIAAAACLMALDDALDALDSSSVRQRRLRAEWLDADETLRALTHVSVACWLVALVLLIVWTHRMHQVSTAVWRGPRRWSSGWAVGGWFVPLANLVIPKLVLGEIERIIVNRRGDGSTDPRWTQHTASSVGWSWWALYLTGAVTLAFFPGGPATVDDLVPAELRAFYTLHLIWMTCWCASGVLGAFHIRQLSSAARR